MKRKQLTERERFTAFVEAHAPKRVDAYWWCKGRRWAERRYCVVLVAHESKHPPFYAGLELTAATPQELAEDVRSVGYKATAGRIKSRCEEHFHKIGN